jgi:hypothetical protein
MANWHVKRNEKTFGPFNSDQLKKLADSGKIKPEDLLKRENQENWVRACEIKGLGLEARHIPNKTLSPPPLIENTPTPPPLPSAVNETQKTPSNQPLSILVSLGFLIAIFMCFQYGMSSSKRKRVPRSLSVSNHETENAKVARSAGSTESTSNTASDKEDEKKGSVKIEFIKNNVDPNAPIMTSDFLPETAERRVYVFTTFTDNFPPIRRTATGVPTRWDNEKNILMSVVPGGGGVRLYIGSAPGDKWRLPTYGEYEFEGFLDNDGKLVVDKATDFIRIKRRVFSTPHVESDFLFQRGIGFVEEGHYRVDDGVRSNKPMTSLRYQGK